MMQTKRQKVIAYCRVSDQKQVQRGDGLQSQERTCREFARMKGLEIDEVFVDVLTGERSDRPGLQEAKAYLRKHRGTVLIVDHANRLGRDLLGYLLLRAEIVKMGAVMLSPVMEFKSDSSSLLVENVVASVSQYQRQHNAEQTKSRMKARIQNGYWVFQPPVGYRYDKAAGRGKILKPDEPVAAVVREALEGFASGRLENQAEVMRFLQNEPLFPKDRTGIVRHQRVSVLLNQPVYAGYVEAPNWGVALRPGQHEALISFQTYQRIQDRLRGGVYAPRRPNLNEDFPLRGHVVCADCGVPLTACWSKGSHSRFPYYLCPKLGCASYRKSIRRETIEGEFETLLRELTPTKALFAVATKMFKVLWDRQANDDQAQAKAHSAKLLTIERQVSALLDRIVDASVPSVIAAYEDRVRSLEDEKIALREKMALGKGSARSYEQTVRTALRFLGNPWELWSSDRLEDKRLVFRFTFAKRLA